MLKLYLIKERKAVMNEPQDRPKSKIPPLYYTIIAAGLALFFLVISPLDLTLKAAGLLILIVLQLAIVMVHDRIKSR